MISSGDTAPEVRSNRKALALAGISMVVGFFLLKDVLGLIEGGGLFSITMALDAARARTVEIDVDQAGLQTAFVALCSLVVTLAAIQLDLDLSKKLTSTAFILSITIGGLTLDGVYGANVVARLMEERGYSRCAARDHVVGAGKSRVWLHNYVIRASDCPSPRHDPAAVPAKLADDPRSQLPRSAAPIGSPARWFTDDDYPALALRRNMSGVVRVAFTIDTDGRVRRCEAIKSSGSPILDTATCGILMTNARYWPARAVDGRRLQQASTQSVRWQIPSDGGQRDAAPSPVARAESHLTPPTLARCRDRACGLPPSPARP